MGKLSVKVDYSCPDCGDKSFMIKGLSSMEEMSKAITRQIKEVSIPSCKVMKAHKVVAKDE